ncbi:MAG: hypothetical protein OEZ23_08115, partial [Gammaproteobacteria bacterium]|nr:hypothetical protein [Gammaproteobacteria bacterium]
FIFTTDADVILPQEYGKLPENIVFSAAIHPFRHHPDPHTTTATLLYEIHLFNYVLGLLRAGSSYAFHSLGSTLVIQATHYARVRGFPKKAAGEDFYLLNKLAKTGRILSLPGPEIFVRGRLSRRVGFGTGPALERILQLNNPVNEYLFYHPMVFSVLGSLLHLIKSTTLTEAEIDPMVEALPATHQSPIQTWLDANEFNLLMQKGRKNTGSEVAFQKHLRDWFDGFRTLRFIHHVRDSGYPSLPLADYLCLAPELAHFSSRHPLNLQRLAEIRQHLAKHFSESL